MAPQTLANKLFKAFRKAGFDTNWATAFMEYGVPEGSLAMRVSYPESKSDRDRYGVTAGFIFVTPDGGVVVKGAMRREDKALLEEVLSGLKWK